MGGVSGNGDEEKLEEGDGVAEDRLSWGDALWRWLAGRGSSGVVMSAAQEGGMGIG